MHDNDHTGRTDGGGHDIELVQHVGLYRVRVSECICILHCINIKVVEELFKHSWAQQSKQ